MLQLFELNLFGEIERVASCIFLASDTWSYLKLENFLECLLCSVFIYEVIVIARPNGVDMNAWAARKYEQKKGGEGFFSVEANNIILCCTHSIIMLFGSFLIPTAFRLSVSLLLHSRSNIIIIMQSFLLTTLALNGAGQEMKCTHRIWFMLSLPAMRK